MRLFIMFTMRHLEILAAFLYLNRFVIFPPVWAHWAIMKCGYLWFFLFLFSIFYFLCSVFLVVFLCFSVGILGAWLYGYHQVTMTGKGFWMLLRLGSQIQKEESRLNGSSHWCFKRKLIWDPTIISVFACIRYSNSVATTICVAKIPTFSALF